MTGRSLASCAQNCCTEECAVKKQAKSSGLMTCVENSCGSVTKILINSTLGSPRNDLQERQTSIYMCIPFAPNGCQKFKGSSLFLQPTTWESNTCLAAEKIPQRPKQHDGGQPVVDNHPRWDMIKRTGNDDYPLVNIQKTMENHHFSWENPLFLWPFSIAMLNYQRVTRIGDVQKFFGPVNTRFFMVFFESQVYTKADAGQNLRPRALGTQILTGPIPSASAAPARDASGTLTSLLDGPPTGCCSDVWALERLGPYFASCFIAKKLGKGHVTSQF